MSDGRRRTHRRGTTRPEKQGRSSPTTPEEGGCPKSKAHSGRPPAVAGPGRKPPWLKVRPPAPGPFRATGELLSDLRLHTVCVESRCPNKGECFSAGTATFLILGDRCTRDCNFCSVESARLTDESAGDAVAARRTLAVDADEPRRVAQAAARLDLRHVVVTSVTRDDLADGGASHFAATVRAVRSALPAATVEVLVPDFLGDEGALDAVLAARPDVLGHNLETVARLYPPVRPGADYGRSLRLLERAAHWARGRRDHGTLPGHADRTAWAGSGRAGAARRRPLVKTGFMLGLGETAAEVEQVLGDCVATAVDFVTVGQYLRPAHDRLPVARYVTPHEFDAVAERGRSLGLQTVAGPFVRSSYRAGELVAFSGCASVTYAATAGAPARGT